MTPALSPFRSSRGSGLIIALGVLALLAVMATTFITLMRIDSRLTKVHTDNVRARLLAAGVVNYCLSVLRDDQDRTNGKYENRDQAVGGRGYWQDMAWYQKQYAGQPYEGKGIWRLSLPGRNTDGTVPPEHRYGTGASNDVWFMSASGPGVETGLYSPESGCREAAQASFGGEGFDFILVDENDLIGMPGSRYYACVPGNFNGRDDDLDGRTDPNYTYDAPNRRWYLPEAALREMNWLTTTHYDSTDFLTQGRTCYLHPGGRLSGQSRLTGGLYWRWAAKMGVPEEAYVNLNAAGNLDYEVDRNRLDDLDGRGLRAWCGETERAPGQVTMLSWKGYANEQMYKQHGGFHRYFNAVQYSPYQVDPYRLMAAAFGQDSPGRIPDSRARSIAAELVRARWGRDGRPADGSPRWRVGWRRDGATWCRIPSPENPVGDDWYFGAAEALDHQSEDIVPGTSRVLGAMLRAAGGNFNTARADFVRLRSTMSTFGRDTILRGKIYPGEGPPYTKTAGDWRHINILKRVNLNLIGASGSEGVQGEDRELKEKWLGKRDHERERLYYMLRALLKWSETDEAELEACQFIASLADMVDTDRDETYFAAPDDSGVWALGVEKFPVFNEVVFYSASANVPDFGLDRLRIELYNPFENIPWIPDEDESFDISNYLLKVNEHVYRLGDLVEFDREELDEVVNRVRRIGADGLYGDPGDSTAGKMSWSRFVHAGWTSGWPLDIPRREMRGGLRFELWKPLRGDAALRVPLDPGKVEVIGNRKCICVDRTPPLFLVNPGLPAREGPGLGSSDYVGCYRRWDPMNARPFGMPFTAEFCSLVWCPGWDLSCATLGGPNTDYPLPGNRLMISRYRYQRRYERQFKLVDGDLPSVGWLGELMLTNCAQEGTFTWVHGSAQRPALSDAFDSELERVKFDLWRPWGKVHNLHVFDAFTIWDPSNDGIDNDGDGAIDDEDTGRQPGDLWGPEVRVFGVIDINHADARTTAALQPGSRPSLTAQGYYPNFERGRATVVTLDGVAAGPRDSIGDLIRIDDLHDNAAGRLGGFDRDVSDRTYSPYKGAPQGTHYGFGILRDTDDDGDGIADERDERDFLFTQLANYLTTRSHTFTVEIVVQITDVPFHPGKNYRRGAYKVRRVYAEGHLVLLVDRSTTLRVNPNGTCDFTGPVRILAQRWSHKRR